MTTEGRAVAQAIWDEYYAKNQTEIQLKYPVNNHQASERRTQTRLTDDTNKPSTSSSTTTTEAGADQEHVSLKILVSDTVANKLTGNTGDAMRRTMQLMYSASLQVSPPGEYYASTAYRIVVISAQVDNLISCYKEIIMKLQQNEQDIQDTGIVVKDGIADTLTERHIAAIEEDTDTRIEISPPSAEFNFNKNLLAGERLWTISGGREERCSALLRIIQVILVLTDHGNMSNNLKYGTSVVNNNRDDSLNARHANGHLLYSSLIGAETANKLNTKTTGIGRDSGEGNGTYKLNMKFPDKIMNIFVSQAQWINKFKEASGAAIEISGAQSHLDPCRMLTIKGTLYQLESAYNLIDDTVQRDLHSSKK